MNSIRTEEWDRRHLAGYKAKEFVTDTSLNIILKYHQLPEPTGLDVLEIGVGHGSATIQLSRLKNRVFACDISNIALRGVEKLAEQTILTQDLADAPPVDLAISHLTIQHNHEDEVVRLISSVNLKEDAVFSFQFASLDPHRSVLSEMIMNDINDAMLYFYSEKKMEALVARSGKSIVARHGPYWFDAPFSFQWHVFHVR